MATDITVKPGQTSVVTARVRVQGLAIAAAAWSLLLPLAAYKGLL